MTAALRWPTVLFDLDGTLVNTIEAIVASYTHTWRTVAGRDVTREQILPWIGRTLGDVFTEQAPAQAAELEQTYMDHNASILSETIAGYPGVPDLLTDLIAAGARTGVATSKRRRTAEPALRIGDIPVETVLACTMEDTDRHKPDPTPLLTGLAVIGGEPATSVYIGDAVVDLQAAAAAGMAGIGVTWGAGIAADLRAQPNVGVVDTVDELRALLFN